MDEYRRLCRWEDNIKMALKEIYVNKKSWIELVKDRDWRAIVNAALNPLVPEAIADIPRVL